MDPLRVNTSVRSAQPNEAPRRFSPFIGTFLGQEESSSALMNIDGKIFLKTVGKEILGANYDVKGHAGQKRNQSKQTQTNKLASATKKSVGTKKAAKKTSKPRKTSANKKTSKPKKKSAGTKKTSTQRKNSANKKKPKKSSKAKAVPKSKQQLYG